MNTSLQSVWTLSQSHSEPVYDWTGTPDMCEQVLSGATGLHWTVSF